ncbi:MFS transporter [Gordonia humi]|uniref:MFS transporter n=1 Tax=Gordonia humi TaxID=686429 RepID=UPI00360FBE84
MPVITLTAIDRGGSVAVAAFIGALIGIASILTNIPSGMLATRIGERLSMVVAAVVSASGLILCILPISVWTLAVGVFLMGSASSVFSLARQSYLTEAVPVHMRARALSTLGGSARIGVFLGPFLAAAVMHFFGMSSAYAVALVAVVGAGVIAYGVPDLDSRASDRAASTEATTRGMLRDHRRVFLTLGTAILLLSAIRQSRQVVIPLWAAHIGLSGSAVSIIYGVAGAIDAATFCPAGKVMDRYGRKAVAIPCMALMALSFVLMPLTHGFASLVGVSLLMGFANGIGSGIVMTLGADMSPSVGRPMFLGLWREFSDVGAATGPVVLSLVTGLASLGAGIVVTGGFGVAAALAFWRWIPPRADRDEPVEVSAPPHPPGSPPP